MNGLTLKDKRDAKKLEKRQVAVAERQAASVERQLEIAQQMVTGQAVVATKLEDLISELLAVGSQQLASSKELLVTVQSPPLSERHVTENKRSLLLLWLAIGSFILTAFLVGWAIWGVTVVRLQVKNIGVDVQKSQFVMTFPANYSAVGLGQVIRGTTPFLDRNHYILVKVVRTETILVQRERASVSPDGAFSGTALFDSPGEGLDEEFNIQVLATKSILSAGILAKAPDDAILSDSITVRRVGLSGDRIVITSPTNGAEVDFDDKILGKTPFDEMNHYIVVTPVRTGTASVQDNAASVNRVGGTFSGTARFGGAEVGVGEQFIVRVVATRSILPAGPLIHEPDDAVASNSVTVRRKK